MKGKGTKIKLQDNLFGKEDHKENKKREGHSKILTNDNKDQETSSSSCLRDTLQERKELKISPFLSFFFECQSVREFLCLTVFDYFLTFELSSSSSLDSVFFGLLVNCFVVRDRFFFK